MKKIRKVILCCVFMITLLGISFYSYSNAENVNTPKTKGYIFANSANKLLTDANVNFLDKRLTRLSYYEILARHGYVFKDTDLKEYFKKKSWYKEDKNYKGSMTNIEKKNMHFLSKRLFLISDLGERGVILSQNKLTQEALFDLNQDGIADKIKFEPKSEDLDTEIEYTLSINSSKVKCKLKKYSMMYMQIVDLDDNDNEREVVIKSYAETSMGYWGDSDYYYLSNKSIKSVGRTHEDRTEEWEGLVTPKGDGKMTMTGNMGVIKRYPWPFKYTYVLTKEHMLISPELNKEFFSSTGDQFITANRSLNLYKGKDFSSLAVKLKPGERIKLLGSDNKNWCYAESESGIRGWFAVDKMEIIRDTGENVEDIFEGNLLPLNI